MGAQQSLLLQPSEVMTRLGIRHATILNDLGVYLPRVLLPSTGQQRDTRYCASSVGKFVEYVFIQQPGVGVVSARAFAKTPEAIKAANGFCNQFEAALTDAANEDGIGVESLAELLRVHHNSVRRWCLSYTTTSTRKHVMSVETVMDACQILPPGTCRS